MPKTSEFWQSSECRILCDTDSLTVLQYNDAEFKKIKIFTYSNISVQNSLTVYPVTDVSALLAHLRGEQPISPAPPWQKFMPGWIKPCPCT